MLEPSKRREARTTQPQYSHAPGADEWGGGGRGEPAHPTAAAATAAPAAAKPAESKPAETKPAAAAPAGGMVKAPEPNPKRGGTIKIGGFGDPAHFDLDQSPTIVNLWPQAPMYDNLIRFNP